MKIVNIELLSDIRALSDDDFKTLVLEMMRDGINCTAEVSASMFERLVRMELQSS